MANTNAIPSTLLLLSKQHDTSNELKKTDGTDVDSVNAARATVISVSSIATAIASPPPGETVMSFSFVGVENLQTTNNSTLQRNWNSTKTAILRNQQGSRTAIKSSSPSATANNNTALQKFHKTDAPMLNYISDSHLTNKHRHYDPRYVLVLLNMTGVCVHVHVCVCE